MNAETISNAEIKPPIDRPTVYFILGMTSELIRRVKNGNNPNDLTDLRIYLSSLTVPYGTLLENYLSNVGMDDDYIQTIKNQKTDIGIFLEGFSYGLRSNRNISWYDYEDPLLRETMLRDDTELDSDSICKVSYRFGRHNVHWVLPKPEVYWQCNDKDKLIHMTLIVMEEIIHMNQLEGDKIVMHTFGNKYDLSSEQSKEFSDYMRRMMEIDVANILTTALPEMVHENWSWYASRKNKPPDDDHYPLTADNGFILGYVFAVCMGQGNEFRAGVMTYMPEYLNRNPVAREQFFSNHYVMNHVQVFLELIYDPQSEKKLNSEEMKMVLEHEFSLEGITNQFLLYCLHMRKKHGENWLEMVDKGTEESEQHQTQHGTKILNMVLNFINTNPKWFDILCEKRSRVPIRLLNRKFKDPDHMLKVYYDQIHK